MRATFLTQPETLDLLVKMTCEVLRVLRLANGGQGLTVLGIVACTRSRKCTAGQRGVLFSHKYIASSDIETAISREENGPRERVMTRWATASEWPPLLLVSFLASISKQSWQMQMRNISGISQTSHTLPGQLRARCRGRSLANGMRGPLWERPVESTRLPAPLHPPDAPASGTLAPKLEGVSLTPQWLVGPT